MIFKYFPIFIDKYLCTWFKLVCPSYSRGKSGTQRTLNFSKCLLWDKPMHLLQKHSSEICLVFVVGGTYPWLWPAALPERYTEDRAQGSHWTSASNSCTAPQYLHRSQYKVHKIQESMNGLRKQILLNIYDCLMHERSVPCNLHNPSLTLIPLHWYLQYLMDK